MVAGCSGGSVNSSGNFVPPGGANAARAMTKAQISLTFSTAGTSSASRQTASLNSTVQQVGIRFIPVPAPAVTPTETVFTIPQPAPASTTLVVDAPVGQDTFILGAYEPPPVCPPPTSIVRQTGAVRKARQAVAAPALVPLNGSVQPVNLSANGANALNVTMGPVAFGGNVTVATQTALGAAAAIGNSQWAPLENFSAAQTVSLGVQPVDVCSNPMSGTVANSVVVSGPGGTAFSPALSTTGTTTGTYAAGANTGGAVTGAGSLPANTAPISGSPAQVALSPDYFIFALDSSGSYLGVVDGVGGHSFAAGGAVQLAHSREPLTAARQAALAHGTRRTLGSLNAGGALAMASVNASSCTGGTVAAAVAIVGSLNQGIGIDVFTVTPNGTVSNPATFIQWPSFPTSATPDAVAFDASCRLYVGDTLGYLGVGSASGIASTSSSLTGITGPGITALVAGPSSLFVGYNLAGNWLVGTAPFGGTTVTPTSFNLPSSTITSIDGLALAGGSVFVGGTANGCFADFRDLSGATIAPDILSPCCPPPSIFQFVGTTNGTLYAISQQGYLVTVSGGSAVPTRPTVGLPSGIPNGAAVTADVPTSSLWLSSNSEANIYRFAHPIVAGFVQEVTIPYPIGINAGPLSIAP
jgi:hypothetical protein